MIHLIYMYFYSLLEMSFVTASVRYAAYWNSSIRLLMLILNLSPSTFFLSLPRQCATTLQQASQSHLLRDNPQNLIPSFLNTLLRPNNLHRFTFLTPLPGDGDARARLLPDAVDLQTTRADDQPI